MYNSIRRQNYTNYRIIQVDDNSDDDTKGGANSYEKINQETKNTPEEFLDESEDLNINLEELRCNN